MCKKTDVTTTTTEQKPEKFDGYALAQQIDQLITDTAAQHSIQDNARSWLNCIRTIESTCNILREELALHLSNKDLKDFFKKPEHPTETE